jgi:hypothetical protein
MLCIVEPMPLIGVWAKVSDGSERGGDIQRLLEDTSERFRALMVSGV